MLALVGTAFGATSGCADPPEARHGRQANARRVRHHTVSPGGTADFTTITDAISAASSGDTITVGAGAYYGSIDFSGKTLNIQSSDGAAATTIYASPGHPIVSVGHGEGPGTILDGFTLSGGGSALEPAIDQQFASLTLKNDIITGTSGTNTIYARSSFIVLAHVTVDGTNTTQPEEVGGGSLIYARRGEAIVKDSDITCGSIGMGYQMDHGSAMVDGSTFHCAGGTAVSIFHSQGRVQRVTLEGVLHVENETTGSEPTVVEGSLLLGGVLGYYSWVQLHNVVVKGDVNASYVQLSAINTVFTGAACAINASASSVSVSYSNFYGNTANACGFSDPSASNGNLPTNPDFVGADDYHPASSSPLIDAGSSASAYTDTDGSRSDVGAYGGPFTPDGGW